MPLNDSELLELGHPELLTDLALQECRTRNHGTLGDVENRKNERRSSTPVGTLFRFDLASIALMQRDKY